MKALLEPFNITPILAVEIEWYVLDASGNAVDEATRTEYLATLTHACNVLPIHSIDAEDGAGQVEAALLPTRDLAQLIADTNQLKDIATRTSEATGLTVCFDAKPFADDYGNGLHVHIHLEDDAGQWLYTKQDDQLSDALSWSIGGLLATMQEHLPIFAGSQAALARYQPGLHAPTTLSWGMNNRTTALRLPDHAATTQGLDAVLTTNPTHHRRIEHRVASSEAEIETVIEALLQGIAYGFSEQVEAPVAIYGDASQAQYGLETLSMVCFEHSAE